MAGSLLLAGSVLKAQVAKKAEAIKMDGGLADIVDKKEPVRQTPIVPPGARGLRHLQSHCTACQLCVSACPNEVLRPSHSLDTFMQPYMSYERGYCRPECTRCSEVCPAGAILKIDKAEKSSIRIGHAVWVKRFVYPTYRQAGVRQLRPPLSGERHHHGPVRPVEPRFTEDSGSERSTLHRLRSLREPVSGPSAECHLRGRP